MDVKGAIACIVVAASRAELRELGFSCEEAKSPVALMPSTGNVHHYDHRLDMMIMITVVSPYLSSPAATCSNFKHFDEASERNNFSCTTSRNNFSTSVLRARKIWGYFIPFSILSILPNVTARTAFTPLPALMIAAAWIKFINMCMTQNTGITNLKYKGS